MSAVLDRLNTALEGRYRIERELGEGGMATVFLADYDVTPDGERFLMVKRAFDRAPHRVVVVTDFFNELRALEGGRDR